MHRKITEVVLNQLKAHLLVPIEILSFPSRLLIIAFSIAVLVNEASADDDNEMKMN